MSEAEKKPREVVAPQVVRTRDRMPALVDIFEQTIGAREREAAEKAAGAKGSEPQNSAAEKAVGAKSSEPQSSAE